MRFAESEKTLGGFGHFLYQSNVLEKTNNRNNFFLSDVASKVNKH